jgi:hypothetical protein
MGYSTRASHHGQTIKTFWPDDDEDTMYLTSSSQHSLSAIINMCKEKWPDTDFNDLVFESEKIQTDCLDYDLYDPGDHTDFIVIRRCRN